MNDKTKLRLSTAFRALFLLLALSPVFASSDPHNDGESENSIDVVGMIMHHISDVHEWHLWGEGESSVSIPLPVIVYGSKGLAMFMSGEFHHDDSGEYVVEKNGMTFVKHHEKIYELDFGAHLIFSELDSHTPLNASSVIDLSITKNVASMFLSILLLVLIFKTIAKSYRKSQVPKNKLTGILESIILFIRDDVAKVLIGKKKYERFTPYLLTLFFFIWINNLLGLVPSGANLTGNIAATMTLAVFTLITVNISGNKNHWKHIFWMPGVPVPIKIFLAPIELMGLFTKPFALMIRLFANITAGHIIILGLFSVVFIFGWAGSPSVLLASCLMILELVVAFMQAYIFTFLTALFIGSAVEESHH